MQDGAIRVLPSGRYLNNAPEGMNATSYDRMVASYYEIVELLGENFNVLNG